MDRQARLRARLRRVRILLALSRAVRRSIWWVSSVKRRVFLDPPVVKRYVEAHPVRKLQIGAGPNPLPGWLNTDLFPDLYSEQGDRLLFLDAAKPFPFRDVTFDYIFSEHMIEHIPEADAIAMVHECFRVLRPGGRIRLATPNLAAIVGLYRDPLSDAEQHYIDWVMTRFRPDVRSGDPRCYVINQMFNAYGHEFIYDEGTLSGILMNAGFVDVVRYEPGQSDDPVFRALESHGQSIGDTGDRVFAADEEVNRFETLVLEVTRPPAGAGR